MIKISKVCIGMIISLGMAAAASAITTIDFSTKSISEEASFTISGVTFSSVGGGGKIIGTNGPNGTRGILDVNDPFKEIRADMAGSTSMVSVDLGDFNADPDLLFLEIFNVGNTSLGFTSELIPNSFNGMKTLTLSASNIAYAIFGARDPALGGSSVFADNFAFESASVPDTGSTALLLGAGLLGLAAIRRKLS